LRWRIGGLRTAQSWIEPWATLSLLVQGRKVSTGDCGLDQNREEATERIDEVFKKIVCDASPGQLLWFLSLQRVTADD
jgi:hypothetical protein